MRLPENRKSFNPYMTSGPVHSYQLDESISNFSAILCIFQLIFYFLYFLFAKSVDSDQTPRSEASDLGLHCLPMSHKH